MTSNTHLFTKRHVHSVGIHWTNNLSISLNLVESTWIIL